MNNSLTQDYIKSILPVRKTDSHKGTFGKILNIAGSASYRGAAYLSSISPLKTGAGYIVLACPDIIAANICALTPDIVFFPLESAMGGYIEKNEFKKIAASIHKYDALSVGCGLCLNDDIVYFISGLIESLLDESLPVVLDADALNSIACSKITRLPKNTIITPHPQELARLLDVSADTLQADRVKYALEASSKYNATVVLKGYQTVICSKDNIKINKTGGSALAKAGTGDVLTGMITGFCAQGVDIFEAACLGVYLHGLAGDLAKLELTEYGVLASDLLRFIHKAIKKVMR